MNSHPTDHSLPKQSNEYQNQSNVASNWKLHFNLKSFFKIIFTRTNNPCEEVDKKVVADDQDNLSAEQAAGHHGQEGNGEVEAGDDQGPSLEG